MDIRIDVNELRRQIELERDEEKVRDHLRNFRGNQAPELSKEEAQELYRKKAGELLRLMAEVSDTSKVAIVRSYLALEYSDTIIKGIIWKKLQVSFSQNGEPRGASDEKIESALIVQSEVWSELSARLQQLGEDCSNQPIDDFQGYVAIITYNKISDRLRRENPKRNSLKNRLRYLLDEQPGLARWQTEQKEWVGGYEQWKTEKRTVDRNQRYRQLLDDPQSFPQIAIARREAKSQPSADLIAAILNYLKGPIELNDLVRLTAEMLGIVEVTIQQEAALTKADDDSVPFEFYDQRSVGGEQREVDRFLLQGLWQEICSMELPHRMALLLNFREPGEMGALDLFLILGIVTLGQLGQAVGLSLDAFKQLWNRLPLPDHEIAALLACDRGQVIALRKTARRRLVRVREKFG